MLVKGTPGASNDAHALHLYWLFLESYKSGHQPKYECSTSIACISVISVAKYLRLYLLRTLVSSPSFSISSFAHLLCDNFRQDSIISCNWLDWICANQMSRFNYQYITFSSLNWPRRTNYSFFMENTFEQEIYIYIMYIIHIVNALWIPLSYQIYEGVTVMYDE